MQPQEGEEEQQKPQQPKIVDITEMLGAEYLKGEEKDDDDKFDDGASLDEDCEEGEEKQEKQNSTSPNKKKKKHHNKNEGEEGEEGEEEDPDQEEEYTEEDREFDTVIGAIENFLVSEELQEAKTKFFSNLPKCDSVELQQEKYILFKKYIELLDVMTDEYVKKALPSKDISEIAELIVERRDRVSDDVFELIAGEEADGGLDYESFVEMWKMQEKGEMMTANEKGVAAAEFGFGITVTSLNSPEKNKHNKTSSSSSCASVSVSATSASN